MNSIFVAISVGYLSGMISVETVKSVSASDFVQSKVKITSCVSILQKTINLESQY